MKIKDAIKKYSRQLSQIIFVCLAIIAITLCMPRVRKYKVDFTKGTPWQEKQLIADFDFNVLKPEDVINAEKEIIAQTVKPRFAYNASVASAERTALEGYIEKDSVLANQKASLKEYTKCLERLYMAGIISDQDAEMLNKKKQDTIIYTQNNKEKGKNVAELVSCSEAKRRMMAVNDSILNAGTLNSIIKPNYTYDAKLTDYVTKKEQDEMDLTYVKVQRGEKIIDNGDLVNDQKYHIIKSYLEEVDKKANEIAGSNRTRIFIGQILFVVIAMFIVYFYLELYQPSVSHNAYKFVFTILTAAAFPIIMGVMFFLGKTNVYILPFTIVPMMLCLFVNNQAAFVIYTISILICSTMLGDQYEFVLLQTAAGYSVILSLKELSSRMQMFRCTLIAFFTYGAVYLCHSFITATTGLDINYMMYLYFAISSLMTLIAYPMMIVFEKVFHFISNVTLIELSNLNTTLLQRLSQEAPGTFQHSIQVSNLAAEAAHAIGANSLLVRTGALYHDIGKTKDPIYFTENQRGGVNPHTSLSYIDSAQIIKKHVTDGVELAKKEGLPKPIQEFITTHHGLSKTSWFYINYKNEHPGEEVDEALFTYPGPKPTTKEQAVLMMADCTEAASHSIKEYTEENINKRVDDVIDGIVKNGELEQSPLTFQDIYTIKDIFKKRLMAIYHTRISYPKEKSNEENTNTDTGNGINDKESNEAGKESPGKSENAK